VRLYTSRMAATSPELEKIRRQSGINSSANPESTQAR